MASDLSGVTKANFFLVREGLADSLPTVLRGLGFKVPSVRSGIYLPEGMLPGESVDDYLRSDRNHPGSRPSVDWLVVRHQNAAYFQREVLDAVDFDIAEVVPPDDLLSMFHPGPRGTPAVPLLSQEYVELFTALKDAGYEVRVTSGHADQVPYTVQLQQPPLRVTEGMR